MIDLIIIIFESPSLNQYRSKDGRVVSPTVAKQLQDGNKYTLVISEALAEDSGQYSCIATNPAGRAKESVQLMVRGKI